MAGNLSVETCGNVFAPTSRQASSNYGVGSDGRIALYVDEKDRSWCSSSASNDNRAVTIEVANDGDASTGWHVPDKAMVSLINLVADICKRNGIKELKWKADKSLIGQVDKQNMTVHRWFNSGKSCPGDYLYGKHSYIANEVNKKLGNATTSTSNISTTTSTTTTASSSPSASSSGTSVNYTVKINTSSLNVRKGAGTNYAVVTSVKQGEIYTIVEESNGWGKLKSGAGWINLSYTVKNGATTSTSASSTYNVKITATAGLNIRKTASTSASKLGAIPYNTTVTVLSTSNGWGKVTYKNITGWISLSYTKKV
jgi:SH3-like domain-containing protein